MIFPAKYRLLFHGKAVYPAENCHLRQPFLYVRFSVREHLSAFCDDSAFFLNILIQKKRPLHHKIPKPLGSRRHIVGVAPDHIEISSGY